MGQHRRRLLQPALFLHFVLTFPERRRFVLEHRWAIPAVYLPGARAVGLQILALSYLKASERLRWDLDRLQMGYLAAFFIAAAGVLWHCYRRAQDSDSAATDEMDHARHDPGNRAIHAVLRDSLSGGCDDHARDEDFRAVAGCCRLTFGYAIFRYRLMDVDLIFKRGMVYTLAAAAIAAAYFAVVAGVAELVHTQTAKFGPKGLVLAIVVTALLFDPFRNWIQERIDQFFYRTRYDYRKTLIEFGRELSSETDLDTMLSSVVDRLSRTLLVDRLAIFLADGEADQRSSLWPSRMELPTPVASDFGFLNVRGRKWRPGICSSTTPIRCPRETPSAQETIAKLELNYYIPCRAHEHAIAVPRPGQDGGRRFPFQRGCAAAGDPGRLHRHRHAERPPVRLARAESRRV